MASNKTSSAYYSKLMIYLTQKDGPAVRSDAASIEVAFEPTIAKALEAELDVAIIRYSLFWHEALLSGS